jgi:hypothetical protein
MNKDKLLQTYSITENERCREEYAVNVRLKQCLITLRYYNYFSFNRDQMNISIIAQSPIYLPESITGSSAKWKCHLYTMHAFTIGHDNRNRYSAVISANMCNISGHTSKAIYLKIKHFMLLLPYSFKLQDTVKKLKQTISKA